MSRRILDEYDEAVYAEAFVMADAVRRFLARAATQRVIDAGLLDRDVVDDLAASADRMWLIRTQRIAAARTQASPPPSPGRAGDMSARDDYPNLVGGPEGNRALAEIDRLRRALRFPPGVRTIELWRFHEAPEHYQALSQFGGDEDWIIWAANPDDWQAESLVTHLTVCDSERFPVANGAVWITCHA